MKFFVVDTLTGKQQGQLYPHQWEIADLLRTPGTGTLKVAIPSDLDPAEQRLAVERLRDLTYPRRRWIAIEDDQGRMVAPPAIIPRKPGRDRGELVIPLVDMRSWFYRAPIRPNLDGTRRNYIRIGSSAVEQCRMMIDLVQLGLDTPGAPRIVVDTPPDTGITRERTCLMLDRKIGEYLDSIQNAERGSEWWMYAARDATDPLVILPHVATGPQRSSRTTPIRIQFKIGAGGNVSDRSWPEGDEEPTRVWGVGDGNPPDQVFAMDESPDIAAGVEVAWETILGPLDGVTKPSQAFEYALRSLQYGRELSGSAEFTISDQVLPLGDVVAGDRGRVVVDDGWEAADLPAARITGRVLSGGRKAETRQVLTLDLANSDFGDTSTVPGEEVTDDGDT